jgi:hypothetical protein
MRGGWAGGRLKQAAGEPDSDRCTVLVVATNT